MLSNSNLVVAITTAVLKEKTTSTARSHYKCRPGAQMLKTGVQILRASSTTHSNCQQAM